MGKWLTRGEKAIRHACIAMLGLTSFACTKTQMGAQTALFQSEQALRTARATGPARTDRAAQHLALAAGQLEQAHALASVGDTGAASCAAHKSQLDSQVATALNVLATRD